MKKTEYTCDSCGEVISSYCTGWEMEGSLVIVDERMPGVADNSKITRHFHNICYREMLEWGKHANPG